MEVGYYIDISSMMGLPNGIIIIIIIIKSIYIAQSH